MAHWIIFVGLGPAIGFASFLLVGSVLYRAPSDKGFAFTMMVGPIFAYMIGLVPALLAACIVRWLRFMQFAHEWFWVSLTGIGLGFGLAAMAGFDPLSFHNLCDYRIAVAFIAICLLSTLSCWSLSRRLAGTARSPTL